MGLRGDSQVRAALGGLGAGTEPQKLRELLAPDKENSSSHGPLGSPELGGGGAGAGTALLHRRGNRGPRTVQSDKVGLKSGCPELCPTGGVAPDARVSHPQATLFDPQFHDGSCICERVASIVDGEQDAGRGGGQAAWGGRARGGREGGRPGAAERGGGREGGRPGAAEWGGRGGGGGLVGLGSRGLEWPPSRQKGRRAVPHGPVPPRAPCGPQCPWTAGPWRCRPSATSPGARARRRTPACWSCRAPCAPSTTCSSGPSSAAAPATASAWTAACVALSRTAPCRAGPPGPPAPTPAPPPRPRPPWGPLPPPEAATGWKAGRLGWAPASPS